MYGLWRMFCAGGAALFRSAGIVLGRRCDAIADWFEERAR